jgi:hypothetical protein
METLGQITSVKKAIDTVAGYLAQPELNVTAYGIDKESFHDTTKISIKIDDSTSFTILLYKDHPKQS